MKSRREFLAALGMGGSMLALPGQVFGQRPRLLRGGFRRGQPCVPCDENFYTLTCGWVCPYYQYSSGNGYYTWVCFCCKPGAGYVYMTTTDASVKACKGCGSSTDLCTTAAHPNGLSLGLTSIHYSDNHYDISDNHHQGIYYTEGAYGWTSAELDITPDKTKNDMTARTAVTWKDGNRNRHIVLYKFTPKNKSLVPICLGFEVTDSQPMPTAPDFGTGYPNWSKFPYYVHVKLGGDTYNAVVLK
jgi:hypothetical protein